jgi:hypothetical protein
MAVVSETSSSWARIHVVRGAAPQRILFRRGEPLCIVVGSDPNAQLCLADSTVAPRQLDVLWDGEHLWLEDKLRLGCTFVNGQLLNEWVLVLGDVLVSFGGVRLWVASAASLPVPAAPDFAALDRARAGSEEHSEVRRSPTIRLTMTPELEALLNGEGGLLP